MLDKFKYIIFKIGIPENTYVEPKISISILCEAVPRIREHKVFHFEMQLFWILQTMVWASKYKVVSIKILK